MRHHIVIFEYADDIIYVDMREIKLYKERYFSNQNLKVITDEFFARIGKLRKNHAGMVFDVGKSALLVVDMQNYFLSENSHAFIPSADAIIDNVNLLTDFFSTRNRPIIFTRHIDSAESPGGLSPMEKWWNGKISNDDRLSGISGKIHTEKGDILVKNSYDSFRNTGLKTRLQNEGIRQLVITGVMTHLCCETTARTAFMEGFEVFMPFDATATGNLDFHISSFTGLSHGFAYPLRTSEILGSIHENES